MRKEQQISTEDSTKPISMPEELLKFIQRDTYSLLIKGYAGTGKTTLALTILRALNSRDNFFYISTRISPKELFSYYPWLAKFTMNAQSTTSEDAAHNTSAHSSVPTFEDARLDEPESLFERITNQLMDIRSPIIIIDSWDAIASFMDKEGRLNNERVLQTWRERAGAKLIFISEHPDDTTLDFLVGGVVELRQRQHNNVRFREIILLKLRGVRIDRPSYVYTLENSVFRSFDPYVPQRSHTAESRPNLDRKPPEILFSNLIRTGYAPLDRALGGGFPRNSVVLLEHDERLNLNVAMSFLAGFASAFLSTGNPVLVQPGGRIGPREVMEILKPSLTTNSHNLVKILWPRKYASLAQNIIVQTSYFASETIISTLKKKYGRKLLLNIIAGYPSLRASEDGEADPKLKDQAVISSARACDLTFVLTNAANRDQFEYFSGVADSHLKLLMINDTLFLQPVLPSSTLFAVEYDKNGQTVLEAVV